MKKQISEFEFLDSKPMELELIKEIGIVQSKRLVGRYLYIYIYKWGGEKLKINVNKKISTDAICRICICQ